MNFRDAQDALGRGGRGFVGEGVHQQVTVVAQFDGLAARRKLSRVSALHKSSLATPRAGGPRPESAGVFGHVEQAPVIGRQCAGAGWNHRAADENMIDGSGQSPSREVHRLAAGIAEDDKLVRLGHRGVHAVRVGFHGIDEHEAR